MASNSGNLLKRRCAPAKKPVTTARALDLGLTRFGPLWGGGGLLLPALGGGEPRTQNAETYTGNAKSSCYYVTLFRTNKLLLIFPYTHIYI